jgi:signal transduction histidine kinase
MILKRFLFPIFILLIFSCKKISDNTSDFTSINYDDSIKKAFSHLGNQKYDSSFYYFEKATILAKDKNQKAYALMLLADIYIINSDFSAAETTITQAFENCESPEYLPYIYNSFGRIYHELHDYDEAIKYYKKSYSDSLSIIDKSILQNNIAVIYLENNEYQKAINLLEKLAEKDLVKNDKTQYAKIIDNLGYAYFKVKKNNSEIISSFVHLSDFFQNKNPSLSYQHAENAFNAAHTVNSPDDKLEALKFMITSSEPSGLKKIALQQIQLSDSIIKARQIAKNQFAKIKFDSKKAIEEFEKQKRLKEYFIIGIIVLFFFGIFIYSRIKLSNKKKIEETAHKTEDRIAKKLHDELANDVHNAIAFAETQNLENPQNKDSLLDSLEVIYTRTRNISNENKGIDTGEMYLEKLKFMINNYDSSNQNVIVNTNSFHAIKISKEIKIAIHRIVQELMVNMKKHSQCSLVMITLKTEKKVVEINYSDNGIGSENIEILRNGLQNAENRILSLNGTINFETKPNKGFKVNIIIPK